VISGTAGDMAIRVGIDQGADLKVLRKLQRQGLIELRQANELEQTWPDVAVQHKKGFLFDYSKFDGPMCSPMTWYAELKQSSD
jgi:capsule polysaccharide export protein KpsC/LpsZ